MATYYVDTASTGGDGTTQATSGATAAFATVAAVNAASFSAGDSVLFKCGCTWNETLTIPSSGSVGSEITYGSYGSGDKPNLAAVDAFSKHDFNLQNIQSTYGVTNEDIVHIVGCYNVVIDGIFVDGKSQHGSICIQFYNNGADIAHDITVQNSTFQNGGINDGDQNGYGLNITGGSYNFTIENNTLINNQGGGIQVYDNTENSNTVYNVTIRGNRVESDQSAIGEGINLGWNVTNILVENNFVRGYANGIPIDGNNDNSPGLTIRNNVIWDSLQLAAVASNSCNISYFHNTLISGDHTVKAFWFQQSTTSTGNTCKNNIVITKQTWWPNIILETGANFDLDNNIYYDTAGSILLHYGVYNTGTNYTQLGKSASSGWISVTGCDANSLSANPALYDTFRLGKSSPCLDAAVDLTAVVSTDYDGRARPGGGANDIGAVEGYHLQCFTIGG